MRFGVLGPLTVWASDGRRVAVPEQKVRAVLADLLANRGRVVSADRLIDDVWGADVPGNPANTLQTKISQLRGALERAEPGGRALVVRRPPGYLLLADDVDAERFTELTDRARRTGDPAEKAGLLSDALALWRGPAFADFADAEFARAEITRLEERRLTALEDRAEVRLALGEHALLADELAELVAAHPLRERLRAAHMRALYRAGRQAEALDSFTALREALAEDLGLDPGPELAALYREILTQSPALAPVPPPARAARPRANLPAALTPLVGREEAVARVRELLAAHRLVTLTGPGGVGKTSLALAAASGLVPAFPDGVWLVELAAETPDRTASANAVAEVVAAAAGVRDAGGGDAVAGLAGALRERRALLVLDNCEHLVEQAAELTGALLRAAPGLRVLATSREPLAIGGETLEVVPPLPEAAAVELFTGLAAASGAALGAEDAEAVAAICRRLDGIPLALELAAARVRALGARGVAERLDDRFRLLATARRDAPARQRTLRAVLDWSWEPLAEDERTLLRRLAVFGNGCTLDAAERVCASGDLDVLEPLSRLVDRSLVVAVPGEDGPRYRLLESVAAYGAERMDEAGETREIARRHAEYYTALAEAADRELYGPGQRRTLAVLDAEVGNLRWAVQGCADRGDRDLALRLTNALTWYWYLRGRLAEARRSLETALAIPPSPGDAEGDPRAVRLPHGAADEARRPQDGPDAVRLPQDGPEAVRPAGDGADAVPPTGDGADAVPPTGDGADAVPPTVDGADAVRLSRAEADAEVRRAAFAVLAGEGSPVREEALERAGLRARWFLGFARSGFGEPADDLVGAVLAEARVRDDRWAVAAALSTRATYALYAGDLAALRRYAGESGELFTELGDRWGRLQSTEQLGVLAEIAGDYAEAARLHREGARAAEDLRMWTNVSFALSRLGRVALLTGDLDRSADFHARARDLAAEQSHKPAEQFAETGLALVARRRGDLAAAEAHLLPWLDWNRAHEVHSGAALVLSLLGYIAEDRAEAERAKELHLRSLAHARKTADPRAVALSLEGLAGAESLAGDPALAARLLGTATTLRANAGTPLPPAERADVTRATTRAQQKLGEPTFTQEFRKGTRTPPEAHDLPHLLT
ncbi:BTAD domain-containing putative transcriptional regulator [Bailinhaonella thermotolerans]|uniref:AfsR/SARP family transcriptional regulator n=1 Tax=Bailinhaonella thermotolerans TaxID=1070861 RepID=A0A3A4AWV1_9ACTN|nr:BTAD domain-containing putative transcriptional regulator [Bailinhaonella thermotolerans]RJL33353.1 AfsR/SARP family transcriptional regulator [Bailinhaonella thermotolerans]